jgi:hypothetical protein
MTLSNESILLSVPVGTGGGGTAIVVVADGCGGGVVLHYHCRESCGEVVVWPIPLYSRTISNGAFNSIAVSRRGPGRTAQSSVSCWCGPQGKEQEAEDSRMGVRSKTLIEQKAKDWLSKTKSRNHNTTTINKNNYSITSKLIQKRGWLLYLFVGTFL